MKLLPVRAPRIGRTVCARAEALRRLRRDLLPLLLLLVIGPTLVQTAAANGIYTCVDDRGRRLTSDRPILECRDREQRILNRDGSTRGMLPPSLTAEERAEKEARERREAEARSALADAVRRDRLLLSRYPNLEAHASARAAALEVGRIAIRASELRIAQLATERQPLSNEAEFYRGRPLPANLRLQIDANEASAQAQRGAIVRQQAEFDRVNANFDAELERLRKLWAGAQPGTLGAAQAPLVR